MMLIRRSTLPVPKRNDRHYEAVYKKIPDGDKVHLSDDELIKLYEEILESVMCPIAQTTLLDGGNEVDDFGIAEDGQVYLKSSMVEYVRNVPSNEVIRSPLTRAEMKSTTLKPFSLKLGRLLRNVKQHHTRLIFSRDYHKYKTIDNANIFETTIDSFTLNMDILVPVAFCLFHTFFI